MLIGNRQSRQPAGPEEDELEPDGLGAADGEALEQKRRRWPWRRILFGLFVAFVGLIGWLAWTAPLSRALEPLPNPALVFLDANGQPFARRGAFKEEPVDVTKLPPHVVDAVLSIEDRRFYDHFGIDVRGIARAAFANLQAGDVVQGGSSITQQLAKTSFLTLERSYTRKIQEVIIALWLEAWLTKDEILSRYLSSVYFGEGSYGLRAAARTYFDRDPEDLTLAEAAMLAGVIKAPSRLAPSRHMERARERAKVVLAAMVDNGKLSAARAAAVRPARYRPGRVQLPSGSYFSDWVLPHARSALDRATYGEVQVRTTLDARLQREAERVVQRALDGNRWLHATQAALVAMRPDGRVVAMVGGRDYETNQFNRATQAERQPGSAFKLFVYLAALRAGMTPDSTVEDRQIEPIDGWSPKNDEGKYRGIVNLRTAFAASSNVAAVRLAQQVGVPAVIKVARDLGVKSHMHPHPSLALGTSTMPLIELTSAYAAVAAGRYPVVPTGLADRQPGWRERIERTLAPLRRWPEREPMLQLLRSAVRNGTGDTANLSIPTYGKTGTTQNHRDALFVGFAGDLVVGVWVGNDDNSPMNGVTGRGLPAEIWRRFMQAALFGGSSGRASAENEKEPVIDIELPEEVAEAADLAGAGDAAVQAIGTIGDIISDAEAQGLNAERAAEAVERVIEVQEELRARAEEARQAVEGATEE